MLYKMEMLLAYEYKEVLTYQIASAMHGILMEFVDPEYGDFLHENNWKPFHQYVTEMKEDSFKWIVCTVDARAREQIIQRLQGMDMLYMKHKGIELKIKEKNISSVTYEEMIETIYFGKNNRDLNIRFVTPTAFKQNGRYVFMPDLKLIFQSLMRKYDSYSPDTCIFDEETLAQIEEHTYIKRYNLRSVRYSLEGVGINAFLGEITVHVNGPEQLVNLIHLLAVYGEYSGIGIKCSLGMGAIRIKR